jgi:hypothetical protein
MPQPPDLERQTRRNLQRKLGDLVEPDAILHVADVALPLILRIKIRFN